MARKNPVAIRGSIKTVPKGARKGQIITRGGRRYRVISYVNSAGTRVRYLQAITACSPAARKPACKKRQMKRKRKNPYKPAPASVCDLPKDQSKWRPGKRYLDWRGVPCVIQRTRAPGGYVGMAHSNLTPSLRGRRVGDRFQFNRQRWVVKSQRTRTGGYRKIAKRLGPA